MFKLEKSVPLSGARVSWPFSRMQPGESFAIPADDALIQKARMAAGIYANKHSGVELTVRKQEDGTARCWRLA